MWHKPVTVDLHVFDVVYGKGFVDLLEDDGAISKRTEAVCVEKLNCSASNTWMLSSTLLLSSYTAELRSIARLLLATKGALLNVAAFFTIPKSGKCTATVPSTIRVATSTRAVVPSIWLSTAFKRSLPTDICPTEEPTTTSTGK